MTRPSFITHAVLHKQRERDQLQNDVDRFLAKGGQVQRLAPGEASELTRDEIKVARRKEALRNHHRRRKAAVEEE